MGMSQQAKSMASHLVTAFRLMFASMIVCCIFYGSIILGMANFLMPHRAEGSLIRSQGRIIGSELIAQGFSRPEYFWPRPSAVEYNAGASGGSNLSPSGERLRVRVVEMIQKIGREEGGPIPSDLLLASGSGLDPHIKLSSAAFQIERVAKARGLSHAELMSLLEKFADRSWGVPVAEAPVNVLLVNLALDGMHK